MDSGAGTSADDGECAGVDRRGAPAADEQDRDSLAERTQRTDPYIPCNPT